MTLLDSHPLLLDKKLAIILGLNQALLVQQIHYWLEKNKEAGRNFHQGKYWTYNTLDQWQEEFPFWGRSTIKRTLKGLEGIEDRTDYRIEIRTAYREIIGNCQLYAIDEKYRAGVGHAIKLLLLEAEGKTRIKIGNNYLPAKIVREDLRKLDYFMVEYAVNRFKEISRSREIINPLAYLKTLIYNSINEMEISLEANLRYEGFI